MKWEDIEYISQIVRRIDEDLYKLILQDKLIKTL